ncbi:hypothetical protein ID866_1137 [Astraeus odoratus]|nr:hypothetical protein ID866_1137 [Astraeus odoratus]
MKVPILASCVRRAPSR